MGPTAAKLAAQVSSVTSAPDAATGTEKATDPRPASNTAGANTQTQTNQPTTSTEANGNAGGEDSYQGWEMHQGKRDVKEGSNNDYQGYGGYEPEGDGYGDYSGGGGGNMVDVGGSTAIKEDGCVYNLLEAFRLYGVSPVVFPYLSMSLSLPSSLLKREEELELAGNWNWKMGWSWWGSGSGVRESTYSAYQQDEGLYRYSIATTISTSTTIDEIDWRIGRICNPCHWGSQQ